jgi:hypothetical protein
MFCTFTLALLRSKYALPNMADFVVPWFRAFPVVAQLLSE